MAPILAYWDVRGLANPIRMLLAHADVRYEDKKYSLGDEAGRNEWLLENKPALKSTLDFPNLPYYIDRMVQMTQSRAILQYLGRKHGLEPKSDQEFVRVLMVTEEMEDIKQSLIRVAYPAFGLNLGDEVNKDIHEGQKKNHLDQLPGKLEALSAFLGEGKWIAGERLTYVDFFVYDILDWNQFLFGLGILEKFEKIKSYLDRFEGLKGVKEFLGDKDKFQRLPIFAPFAVIGNTADYKPS